MDIKQNQPKDTTRRLSLCDMGALARLNPGVFVKPLVGSLDRHLSVPTKVLEDMSGAMTESEAQLSATTRNQNLAAGVEPGTQMMLDRRKASWAELTNPVELFKKLLS
jgi:hypothetical protein